MKSSGREMKRCGTSRWHGTNASIREAARFSPDGYPQTPPYQWWNYHDVHDAAT
jgi:hypothetical protein